MSKKSRANRNRINKPSVQVNTQVQANNQVQKVSQITKETVVDSSTLEEFAKKKDLLVQKLDEELKDYEDKIGNTKNEYETLVEKNNQLKDDENVLREQLAVLQKSYSDIERSMKKVEEDSENIRKQADDYADKIKKQADIERMDAMTAAADEAKKIWQNHIDNLTEQLKDIEERENELSNNKRQYEKDKNILDDKMLAIDELKDILKLKEQRYDEAKPAEISGLKIDLEDMTRKYEILKERYTGVVSKLEELQVIMDTLKVEIQSSDEESCIVSIPDLVSSLHELKDKYEKIKTNYTNYPGDEAIEELITKAEEATILSAQNEALEEERTQYLKEINAARNAKRELEIIKQEVEATNVLNEHLLRELESHKTALESRTGNTCPSLSKVDSESENEEFLEDIRVRKSRPQIFNLQTLVNHVKNFAGCDGNMEKLYYTDNDIRAFLSGMAVSRLIILQGMSGTGKSSLPRVFAKAISGFNRLIPVESSWRDRNELLGYYNDFNKKFNAKSFTIELYRSGKEKCSDIPTFIILDEMNLARIEYYFSDFLAILQEPDHKKWLIELVSSDMRTLPMELSDSVKMKMKREKPDIYGIWEKIEKSRKGDLNVETSDEEKELLTSYLERIGQLTGAKDLIDGRKIRVTDNIWFIGTANRDESTFEISDKVYDRAQVIDLNKKGIPEDDYKNTGSSYISASNLEELFAEAVNNFSEEDKKYVVDKLDKLDCLLMEKFDMSFGNRIVTQTIDFTAVFVKAGGSVIDALDYQISTKIIRKVITSDNADALLELLDEVKIYPRTNHMVEKRLKELE